MLALLRTPLDGSQNDLPPDVSIDGQTELVGDLARALTM